MLHSKSPTWRPSQVHAQQLNRLAIKSELDFDVTAYKPPASTDRQRHYHPTSILLLDLKYHRVIS
jgi:hypothetical protein